MLPDDVILAIFDFCVDEDRRTKEQIEGWQTLVHVCRKWRSAIFESPRRLNLRLVCTSVTPARDTRCLASVASCHSVPWPNSQHE
jgi:hypothetical protein